MDIAVSVFVQMQKPFEPYWFSSLVERDRDDPYVQLGITGVRYAGDSEHYFFLDFLPWCESKIIVPV